MTTPSFSTCDLCDAHLARIGLDFQVLPPVFLHWGRHNAFCGPVSTVQCHEDNSRVREALATPGEGRVLVVDGAGSLRRALVGGNIAVSAVKNGWSGIVVNGCVRDVAELQACDIGIRALGLVPLPTEKRGAGLRDVPVQMQGVWIYPGDWLYADADGIVVGRQPLL